MDVDLYVYDISKGLARDLSLPITGVQMDAIYHTSLVFGGVEYFFGRGIQQAAPGTTHHGQPMQKVHLGRSELPLDVIIEYMESLAKIYTAESYDLFLRNCNNFTHDLAMFLVGKGIPDHIRNLPETFLRTPFGQMMQPYIDNMLRGAAQGPEPSAAVRPSPFTKQSMPGSILPGGKVYNVTTTQEIDGLLSKARDSCAVIFFTSATCAPCKLVYSAYDQLAEEAGSKAILIKVDLNQAFAVSARYGVRATPTFMTFLKGNKENEWSGADEGRLRGNVRLLIEMAWPPHSHHKLKVPSLQRKVGGYLSYKKVPPLDKLIEKAGPANSDPGFQGVVSFIKSRASAGPAESTLPDLPLFADFIQTKFPSLPAELHFAVIDLVRVAFIDSRISGYFAGEDKDHTTLLTLLSRTNDLSNCPYNHQLVMNQLACNLFTSPLYPDRIVSSDKLRETSIKLATTSMIDSHGNLRAAGASLIYNLAAFNHNARLDEQGDRLPIADQLELVAALLEAIRSESESTESLRGFLLSLGLLLYAAPLDGEVADLCRVMDARQIVADKRTIELFAKEPLVEEIGDELLTKGLLVL